jgi:hypothetical protein
MPVSRCSSAADQGIRRRLPIDKSKFATFKPLSLDVIFHGCEITGTIQGKIDAFAG